MYRKEKKINSEMLLCRMLISGKNKSGVIPVYLNVYDLTPINGYAYWLGLGVYHSGVQGFFFFLFRFVVSSFSFPRFSVSSFLCVLIWPCCLQDSLLPILIPSTSGLMIPFWESCFCLLLFIYLFLKSWMKWER